MCRIFSNGKKGSGEGKGIASQVVVTSKQKGFWSCGGERKEKGGQCLTVLFLYHNALQNREFIPLCISILPSCRRGEKKKGGERERFTILFIDYDFSAGRARPQALDTR